MCACVCMCIFVCVNVCVCVYERTELELSNDLTISPPHERMDAFLSQEERESQIEELRCFQTNHEKI